MERKTWWIGGGVALALALALALAVGWAFAPRPVEVELAGVTQGPFETPSTKTARRAWPIATWCQHPWPDGWRASP